MYDIQLNIGVIHFVGIGGIGMSGIAEVMHVLGYKVQGSDISNNKNIDRLRALGISVIIGHDKDNISGAGVIVVSSAIKKDNPELIESRKKFIPVVQRAEMLAELMRFKWSVAVGGTHGKTTTTSMISAVLEAGSFDPTVINGGIIKAYKTNTRQGSGDWMVVEADESDGTFIKLPATVAVVTNIDPEHLDFYNDFSNEVEAFRSFVKNIPFYGFAVMCNDHKEVRKLKNEIVDRKIFTYGIETEADIIAKNIRYKGMMSTFDVIINLPNFEKNIIKNIKLNMPGQHNVLNSLSAFLIGMKLGISKELIIKGIENFQGVERRFSKVGEVNGILIIDDYAHHPIEISSVIKAAKEITSGKLITIMQPHRYSRLESLFEDFCKCFDQSDVIVISEVFSAGEKPINGISRDTLISSLLNKGYKDVIALENFSKLPKTILDIANSGDMVLCLGAGNISKFAQKLPDEINKLILKQVKV
ncbi:UDP-N-acetylmuramate--L-alanine ligase [Alphaproteobacteria bacterium]|nr:UDP-N-acetylmuramate--L-alanine ligase [Alphaproteobacteria bacterium]